VTLVSEGDPLPSDFAAGLAGNRDRVHPWDHRVVFFETIGSTNDVALALATAGAEEGTIVLADRQTAGRGRHGRSWFSPSGNGLYVSIVLRPGTASFDPNRTPGQLTLAAGVALAEAIETATGLRADIKWPNDLLVGQRKLAGILAETSERASVILGYGINIGSKAYPPELVDRATSLESELGRPIDRAAVWAETLVTVAARYRDLLGGRSDSVLDAWRSRAAASLGVRVTWNTPAGPRSGVTAGIDQNGGLIVRTGDRSEILSGEVTWM
jgi:BirA family biotin operon repressor/biotin-[acetyl-CoA-carboxylase] ligase